MHNWLSLALLLNIIVYQNAASIVRITPQHRARSFQADHQNPQAPLTPVLYSVLAFITKLQGCQQLLRASCYADSPLVLRLLRLPSPPRLRIMNCVTMVTIDKKNEMMVTAQAAT